MMFDSIMKVLVSIWIFMTVIMYMALTLSIVGVVYGVMTGSPLTELWANE